MEKGHQAGFVVPPVALISRLARLLGGINNRD